jgi:hypothetical protein
VPVVCSSPDYMACHSQIFPSIWGSVRSDDLPVLSNPRQKFVCSRYLFKVLGHERRVGIRGAQLYER